MVEAKEPSDIEKESLQVEKVPLAVEKIPLAVEKVPLAVEKIPVAVEKIPLALKTEPIKKEPPNVEHTATNGTNVQKETTVTNGSTEPKDNETAVPLRPAPEPKKTWKYQGPPAINVSTWGERPKSQVYIKSDNDYIFGGSGASKMAALQKRFSVNPNEEKSTEQPRKQSINDPNRRLCENEVCKLPIVRGVEYKKNVRSPNPAIEKNNQNGDTIDSTEQMTRPSYEISRLVSDKPFAEKQVTTTSFVALNRLSSVPAKIESRPFSSTNVNGKAPPGGQRINGGHYENDVNGNLVNGNELPVKTNGNGPSKNGNAVEIEKPLFSQFALRKTGLKEKILIDDTVTVRQPTTAQPKAVNLKVMPVANGVRPKSNPIPTAPKPPAPPVLKKPALVRPVSMIVAPVSVDQRDDLLNSIRNFKRGDLKRNCMV